MNIIIHDTSKFWSNVFTTILWMNIMAFLWINFIAFPGTEIKMNDQKNLNSGSNESTLDLSLVENYIRLFEFQILSSTYNLLTYT